MPMPDLALRLGQLLLNCGSDRLADLAILHGQAVVIDRNIGIHVHTLILWCEGGFAHDEARDRALNLRLRGSASETGFIATIVVAFTYFFALLLLVPAPAIEAQASAGYEKTFHAGTANTPWPSEPSAISIWGSPVIESNAASQLMPMASIAKLVCALVSLEIKPLASTEGQTYQLGPKDTKYYRDFLAQDGSVAPVSEEVPLTRRQLLELMLLPSSNNHTLSYVDWMFGSNEAYVTAAQAFLKKHDLTEITVVESTGFDLGNVASARTLVKIGALALADPTLSEIMAKKSVVIPGAGEVFSTNPLLSDPGVRGMKTGTTTAEKKNLLLAQDFTIAGRTLTSIIVTLGLPSDEQRVIATRKLAQFVTQFKQPVEVAQQGEVVAESTAWDGRPINLVAARDETVVLTLGESAQRSLELDLLSPGLDANSPTGFIVVDGPTGAKRIPVVIRDSLPIPDPWWRITHPVEVLSWLTPRLS